MIWSDGKQFTFDRPDGLLYYWHDSRNEPQYFAKRRSGCERTMIWGAFCNTKKVELRFIDIELDELQYRRILEATLFVTADDFLLTWTFMPEEVPCQRELIVTDGFIKREFAFRTDRLTLQNWTQLKIFGNWWFAKFMPIAGSLSAIKNFAMWFRMLGTLSVTRQCSSYMNQWNNDALDFLVLMERNWTAI